VDLLGWVGIGGGGGSLWGSWYRCSVYGSHVGLGGGGVRGFVGLVCLTSSRSSSGLLFSAGFFFPPPPSRFPLCVRVRGWHNLRIWIKRFRNILQNLAKLNLNLGSFAPSESDICVCVWYSCSVFRRYYQLLWSSPWEVDSPSAGHEVVRIVQSHVHNKSQLEAIRRRMNSAYVLSHYFLRSSQHHPSNMLRSLKWHPNRFWFHLICFTNVPAFPSVLQEYPSHSSWFFT